MEKKEQVPNQTQDAMTNPYYPDERDYWWNSRLGVVRLYIEDEGVEGLDNLEPVVKIYERCNCYELFGSIQHNDGGNYHRIIRVFKITPEIWLVSYEDTREAFYASELRYAVISINGEPIGKVVLKEGEWCKLLRKDEVEKLIRTYSEDEDYTVYNVERE
jgi:hypothetical protein